MQNIFVIEDDKNIRDLIIYALKKENFSVQGFNNSCSFYKKINQTIPNLLILDIMIPGDNGFIVLEKLRKSPKTKNLPIIILTAKTNEYDKVKGLDMGADDYISKPFSILEMVSRVKAVLRRYNISNINNQNNLLIGSVQLNATKRTVIVENNPIDLTFKEFELLQYLMENENIVLSREQIMNNVWNFDFYGESRTIDMHIKTLRQKLGSHGKMIKTIRNLGYKIGV